MAVASRVSPAEAAARAVRRGACQTESELAGLLCLLDGQQINSVVEVGTATGATLAAISEVAQPDALLISVDYGPHHPTGHPYVEPEKLRGWLQPEQTLAVIWADSQQMETAEQVRALLPDGADLLFIDADHRLRHVLRDHELYAALVRPGGLVAFHDISTDNPSPGSPRYATEVAPFWRSIQPLLGECWEWQDAMGIGAYRKPLL